VEYAELDFMLPLEIKNYLYLQVNHLSRSVSELTTENFCAISELHGKAKYTVEESFKYMVKDKQLFQTRKFHLCYECYHTINSAGRGFRKPKPMPRHEDNPRSRRDEYKERRGRLNF
jgi:hypothetical protein